MGIHQGTTDRWIKSSYSANGACLEVRSPIPQAVAVRDSKVPTGPRLTFRPEAWTGFVGAFCRATDGSAHHSNAGDN